MDHQPTVPFGEPELWRVSTYQRAMAEAVRDGVGSSSRFAALGSSMLADLGSYENEPEGAELLEVLAASLRHAQNVALHLSREGHVVPLTVFPQQRLFHTPLPLDDLLGTRFDEVSLLQAENAVLRPPGDRIVELAAPEQQCHPLGQLIWHLAMYGPRRELLPELRGPAAYRVVPDLQVPVPMRGALGAAIERLQQAPAALRSMTGWPGLDRERAERLLNALYLQAGLIISRSHPAALGDTWFGALTSR
jgi:hypothetical protein